MEPSTSPRDRPSRALRTARTLLLAALLGVSLAPSAAAWRYMGVGADIFYSIDPDDPKRTTAGACLQHDTLWPTGYRVDEDGVSVWVPSGTESEGSERASTACVVAGNFPTDPDLPKES